MGFLDFLFGKNNGSGGQSDWQRLEQMDRNTVVDFVLKEGLENAVLSKADRQLLANEAMREGVVGLLRAFPQQKHTVKLTSPEIRNLVKSRVMNSDCTIEVSDSELYAVDTECISRFALWVRVSEEEWVPDSKKPADENELRERFGDCDNFAIALSGLVTAWDGSLTFGRGLGFLDGSEEYHYFNMLIDTGREVCIVDAQTNNIRPVSRKDRVLFARF